MKQNNFSNDIEEIKQAISALHKLAEKIEAQRSEKPPVEAGEAESDSSLYDILNNATQKLKKE